MRLLGAVGLAESIDGKRIVSATVDGVIRVWDSASGSAVSAPISMRPRMISSLALSPDARRIASGTKDGVIQVWDSASSRSVAPAISVAGQSISGLALSPDGNTLAAGTDHGSVHVWDVETGRSITPGLDGDSGDPGGWRQAVGVAFSSDGTHVMSAGAGDDKIRLWNLRAASSAPKESAGHQDNVNATAFSPTGKYVISGANDGTVRLWLAATGEPVGQPLDMDPHDVTSVTMSPDERVIAAGASDGTVHVWPGPAAWTEELCSKFTPRMSEEDWKNWVSPEIGYQQTCPPT
jgi:WD40 repeat protein